MNSIKYFSLIVFFIFSVLLGNVLLYSSSETDKKNSNTSNTKSMDVLELALGILDSDSGDEDEWYKNLEECHRKVQEITSNSQKPSEEQAMYSNDIKPSKATTLANNKNDSQPNKHNSRNVGGITYYMGRPDGK